jgi:O-antigen/teichoic acid export membrane protein
VVKTYMAIRSITACAEAAEFLFVAVPKILGGLLTFVLNLILLRHLGPLEFGIYALCIALILLADAIVGSSMDMSVLRLAPLYRDTNHPLSLGIQRIGLWIKVGLASLCCALLSLFAGPVSRMLFHQNGLQSLLYVTCGAVGALLLLRSAQVHPQVSRRFFWFGLLEMLQLLTKFGGIGLLLLSGHVTALNILLFFVLGPLVSFVVWGTTIGREFSRAAPFSRAIAGEVWRYSRWFLFTFGLAAFISRLDLLLLARWSTLTEVGIFSAGQTVAWVPQLLGTYLAVVFTPRIMPLVREHRFYDFFSKFQFAILGACVSIYLVCLIAAPSLGNWLLPPKYAKSLVIVLVLLPGALAGLATFPVTIGFVMFMRPRFLFAMDCISLVVLFLLYRYAIGLYGAIGAAIVTTTANLSRATIAQIMAWRWARALQVIGIPEGMPLPDPLNLATEVGR